MGRTLLMRSADPLRVPGIFWGVRATPSIVELPSPRRSSGKRFMRRRVLLIVETALAYGRSVLRGINRYVVTHDSWSISLDLRELMLSPPPWLNDWEGDGIITRSTNQELADQVKARGLPTINLADIQKDLGLPTIWTDHAHVGELAATHLLDRGFRQFGYCGFSGHAWSAERREGFISALDRGGSSFDCRTFESPWNSTGPFAWDERQQELVDWLSQLPKPCGIMACNDMRGQHVLNACREASLSVPEEIAVIGVDDDALLCELCDPPLSSVITNAERIGYDAAAALDTLMNSGTLDWQHCVVSPVGVRTRQSTDSLAINDALVAAAVRLIRQRACEGLSVVDILQEVPLSRSMLERRFRKYLGRSPQAEIRHVQVRRVKQLLVETDLTLERIAQLTGFDHPEYLSVLFRREVGETPGHYRTRLQPGQKHILSSAGG